MGTQDMTKQTREYWNYLNAISRQHPVSENEKLVKEKAVKVFWNHLTDYHKHIVLMHLYRMLTEPPEEIVNYLEILRFTEMQITPDDLPIYINKMTPEKLYDYAYQVINERPPRKPSVLHQV